MKKLLGFAVSLLLSTITVAVPTWDEISQDFSKFPLTPVLIHGIEVRASYGCQPAITLLKVFSTLLSSPKKILTSRFKDPHSLTNMRFPWWKDFLSAFPAPSEKEHMEGKRVWLMTCRPKRVKTESPFHASLLTPPAAAELTPDFLSQLTLLRRIFEASVPNFQYFHHCRDVLHKTLLGELNQAPNPATAQYLWNLLASYSFLTYQDLKTIANPHVTGLACYLPATLLLKSLQIGSILDSLLHQAPTPASRSAYEEAQRLIKEETFPLPSPALFLGLAEIAYHHGDDPLEAASLMLQAFPVGKPRAGEFLINMLAYASARYNTMEPPLRPLLDATYAQRERLTAFDRQRLQGILNFIPTEKAPHLKLIFTANFTATYQKAAKIALEARDLYTKFPEAPQDKSFSLAMRVLKGYTEALKLLEKDSSPAEPLEELRKEIALGLRWIQPPLIGKILVQCRTTEWPLSVSKRQSIYQRLQQTSCVLQEAPKDDPLRKVLECFIANPPQRLQDTLTPADLATLTEHEQNLYTLSLVATSLIVVKDAHFDNAHFLFRELVKKNPTADNAFHFSLFLLRQKEYAQAKLYAQQAFDLGHPEAATHLLWCFITQWEQRLDGPLLTKEEREKVDQLLLAAPTFSTSFPFMLARLYHYGYREPIHAKLFYEKALTHPDKANTLADIASFNKDFPLHLIPLGGAASSSESSAGRSPLFSPLREEASSSSRILRDGSVLTDLPYTLETFIRHILSDQPDTSLATHLQDTMVLLGCGVQRDGAKKMKVSYRRAGAHQDLFFSYNPRSADDQGSLHEKVKKFLLEMGYRLDASPKKSPL